MKFQDLLEHLQQSKTENRRYADVFNNIGVVLSYLGKYDEALESFDEALETNPEYMDAALSRCYILGELKRAEEGFREFKMLLVRSPHDLRVLLSLGIYCMRHGWQDSGNHLIQRAANTKPDAPFLLAYAAAAHLEMGNEDAAQDLALEARSACDRVGIEIGEGTDPETFPKLSVYRKWENPYTTWRAHLLLANYMAEMEDFESAWKEFLAVHTEFPGHVSAMLGLAGVALALGKIDEARQWFSKMVASDPESHMARVNLGLLLADNGDLDKAIAEIRAAVALRPLFPDYLYHLGNVLVQASRLDEGIVQLERSLIMNPNYGVASLQLARALLAGGERDRTLHVLEAGPCSDWPEALVVAADAYGRAGRRKEAVAALEKALETDPSNDEARRLLDNLSWE